MLACYPARRPHEPSASSHLDFFNNNSSAPSPTELSTDKQLRNYFESAQQPRPDHYMSTFDFSNPPRVNQASMSGNFSTADLMMLSDNNGAPFSWNSLDNTTSMPINAARLQAPIATSQRSHRRSPSSTTGSNLSAATHNAAQSFQYYPGSDQTPATPQVPKVDSSSSYTLGDNNSSTFSNHLPTPSHTPTQDNFANSYSNNYSMNMGTDNGMAAHLAVKQALVDQQPSNESGCPDFGHSSRQSVSSYGTNSPATPHNGQEDADDRFKVPSNGETSHKRVDDWIDDYLQYPDDPDLMRQTVPKLDRTMTDIYADELYNPNATIPQAQSTAHVKSNAALLSPFRSIMSDRLQAAHNARSQSPASSMSRGASPFRQGSPLAPTSHTFPSPQVRLGTAQQMREQQKAEADAYALQRSQRQPDLAEPKTISPKDALLDYHETEEDSKMPLFPDASANDYGQQLENASDVSYGSTATSQGGNWSAVPSASFPSVPGPSPPQSAFSFQATSIPNVMQGLGVNQQYRAMPNITEQTPEFHPQLTSMESSASEMPESSQNSNDDTSTTPTQKPSSTHADTGTYTCTYHGCSLRFETPQKLQKHKREGHRPAQSTTPGVGSGMTSAALLARNSQAGPHKCERTNPTTGKPCNTVFSRPYDLTRHEDTIHNIRKQKVRCALCVEDKTFSRNDALTRHMRVVHPDVDFPGKHRRRGGGGSYE
ncbi:hypothetical protein IWX90DRAFT_9019 [Phyllosticta citrichinensis]|uniref:C2H2-type domain-containing protein n=1 Tax=Phyllosticta citrichinensis TaxID=1130410 RepID=A0ABR1Y5H5_9PEZI